MLLLLGGLAGLGATLTLPGIAGLILSIGMAVDANVLILERIREELAAGKTSRTAVDSGFANALSGSPLGTCPLASVCTARRARSSSDFAE